MPVYDTQCSECGEIREDLILPFTNSGLPPCTKCGRETEKLWTTSFSKSAETFPYVTKNIHPDGKPIEVTSASHLKRLCKTFGIVHRPDVAWVEKSYHGVDFKTGEQQYSEGSGLGRPGCWI